MDEFEHSVIAALVRRAEGGDGQAALRLHKMYAAGIRPPKLIPYREPPRTGGRHRVRPRCRGRPSGLGGDRRNADGTYRPNSSNTLWAAVPAPIAAAMALVLSRREGHRGQVAFEKAVEVLYARTGRYVTARHIRRVATSGRRAFAKSLLCR